MKVKIKDKQQLSSALLEIQFDLLGQPFPFIAGQFFSLTLINPPYTDERGNSRKFGFTNSPTVQDTISMMTKTGISAFKKSLQELSIGTEVEIDGIDGHNHLPAGDVQKPFVWIADAIGVAPFMSIAREIKAKALQNKVTLIYVCKTQEEAVFAQELEAQSNKNPSFKFIPIISEENMFNPDLIKQLLDFQNSLYVITGEQSFVIPSFKILKDVQIEAKNIAMEIFTGY
jgi:predicted ferric reductase